VGSNPTLSAKFSIAFDQEEPDLEHLLKQGQSVTSGMSALGQKQKLVSLYVR
jgi:hypothetical protein